MPVFFAATARHNGAMTDFTRRMAIQSGLAAAMLPSAAARAAGSPAAPVAGPGPLPAEVDIAVVGAGMAGLAAAAMLTGRNRTVAVLEARDRIGGRIWTDTARLGVPVDLGAASLRSSDINPLVAELRRREVSMQADDGDFWLFDRDGQGRGRDAETLDYDALGVAYDRLDDALVDAKVLRADVALASRIKLDGNGAAAGPALGGRWADLARALAGPLHLGVEFGQVAALDAPRLAGTGNEVWLPGGLGGWLGDFARGLPVHLSRAVTRIEWSARGVTLTTAEGQVRASACIVTLPVGVLAQGGGRDAPRFEPDLPEVQRDALGRLGMGLLDRIALLYEPGSFEAPVNTQALSRSAAAGAGFMAVRLNVQAQPVAVALVGGDYARDLEARGEAAAIAAAREQLKGMLGDEVDRRFVRGIAAAWGRDPWSRGAVCVARPGFSSARRLAGRALSGSAGRARVLFAGEAFAPQEWIGSVAGAWLSGRAAAAEALRVLG